MQPMAIPKRCPAKASLKQRSLMSNEQAVLVESLFEILANDTRLRLLHEIARHDEVCVSDLAKALEMRLQAISNQLQRLVDRSIVVGRREGNNVYYRIIDQCIVILLERALCLVEENERLVKG